METTKQAYLYPDFFCLLTGYGNKKESKYVLFNLFLSKEEARISEKTNVISKLNLAIFEAGQIRDEYFLYKEDRSRDQSYSINEEITALLKKMAEKFTGHHEKEIEKNKGILYDEKVVEVCLKLFREKGFSFE